LQIIGSGLVARALAGRLGEVRGPGADAVAFAAGVADSACLDPEP
jgi:hypothetical protein